MTDYERPEGGVPYDDAVLNWVVYSHDELGYKAGQWLADHFRSVGNFDPSIVVLWGPAGSEISEARGGGVLRALEEAEDINVTVVYEAHANFNRELAYNETERALAAYDFDGVVGLNSYMAVSAKNALLANGKAPGEITVVGMGGTIDELQAVALREIGVAPFPRPAVDGPRLGAGAAAASHRQRGRHPADRLRRHPGLRQRLPHRQVRSAGDVRRERVPARALRKLSRRTRRGRAVRRAPAIVTRFAR